MNILPAIYEKFDSLQIKNGYEKKREILKSTIEINGKRIELNFQPFDFQLSLAQKGCDKKNNIVCLRTGGGKTLVAAIICKYWQSLIPNLKVAFLVPTRHLARQQCEAFEKAFDKADLQEVEESMNGVKIANKLKDKRIMFMTPQKLVNTLSSDLLKLSDFDIIVFDEAHHTNDNHPYNVVMSTYFSEMVNGLADKVPLIIGLTASLGTGATKDGLIHLLKLSANLACRDISNLSSIKDIANLNDNIPSPLKDIIYSIQPQINQLNPIVIKLTNVILEIANQAELKLDKFLSNANFKMGEPEFDTFLKEAEAKAAADQNRDRTIALKYIWELNILLIRLKDFSLNFCVKLLVDFYADTEPPEPTLVEIFAREQIQKLINFMGLHKNQSNRKLDTLVQLVKKYHRPDSRGLILVRTRLHTKAISEYLNECVDLKESPLASCIKTCVLTGQGSSEQLLMNEAEQKRVIDDFRNGERNLMIATDIAQEGLDVARCQYVIRYEFVSNEIGTVQSRGRARAINGQCFLITTNGSLNEKRELINREKEDEMRLALEEYNKIDSALLSKEYDRYHTMRIQETISRKSMSESSSMQSIRLESRYKPSSVKIHCKDCSRELFRGSDLKYREPSYYCQSTVFAQQRISVDRASNKFHCANRSCNKELGRLVALRNAPSLHMIEVKGIKLVLPNGATVPAIKKWSRVREFFQIDNLN